MRKLMQHIVWYVAVNGLLVAIWLLVGAGSIEALRRVGASPSESVVLGFWPVWPILVWGTLLVIHAGNTVSDLLFGRRAMRRRRRIARGAADTSKEIAKDVISAIDKAHGRRTRRRAQEPAASVPSRRWVTVMFCDIADSTLHNERLGDEEWAKVLAHIRGIVRSALKDRNGAEVGTQGDGMLARFEGPADAVLCAIDVQSELGQARRNSDFVPEVRIGVHAGDAVEEEGDLIGRVINLASRVTDEAEPGEILVTEPVADQLTGKLEIEDKGLRPLKGLSQPRHLLAVRWSDQR